MGFYRGFIEYESAAKQLCLTQFSVVVCGVAIPKEVFRQAARLWAGTVPEGPKRIHLKSILRRRRIGAYRAKDGDIYLVIEHWVGRLDRTKGGFVTVPLPKEYLEEISG